MQRLLFVILLHLVYAEAATASANCQHSNSWQCAGQVGTSPQGSQTGSGISTTGQTPATGPTNPQLGTVTSTTQPVVSVVQNQGTPPLPKPPALRPDAPQIPAPPQIVQQTPTPIPQPIDQQVPTPTPQQINQQVPPQPPQIVQQTPTPIPQPIDQQVPTPMPQQINQQVPPQPPQIAQQTPTPIPQPIDQQVPTPTPHQINQQVPPQPPQIAQQTPTPIPQPIMQQVPKPQTQPMQQVVAQPHPSHVNTSTGPAQPTPGGPLPPVAQLPGNPTAGPKPVQVPHQPQGAVTVSPQVAQVAGARPPTTLGTNTPTNPTHFVIPQATGQLISALGGASWTTEVVEPGINNQRVELYRSEDAREVLYQDVIPMDKTGFHLTVIGTRRPDYAR